MTMEESEALDFFERVTEGTKHYELIDLEHKSGAVLKDVEMHPVDKQQLASIVGRLPDEMFEAVEDAETPEEAEEQIEEGEMSGGLGGVDGETVEAFEDLCKKSLRHSGELTSPQMKKVIDELAFEVLFEIGTEIINISSEQTGDVQGFRKQE